MRQGVSSPDDGWLQVVDAFAHAAITGGWQEAMDRLCAATGAHAAQLVGMVPGVSVPFHCLSGLAPEWDEEFRRSGGLDLDINPCLTPAFQAGELEIVNSADFLTPSLRQRNDYLIRQARDWDVAHICMTALVRKQDGQIGLSVMRSQAQGEITGEALALFASLAPHVRAAMLTHQLLDGEQERLLVGALDAMSLPVFLCDRHGRVRAMTAAAEVQLARPGGVCLRQGLLSAASPQDARSLADAMLRAVAGSGQTSMLHTLVLDAAAATPMVLDVIRLPARLPVFRQESCVIVLIRQQSREQDQSLALLRTVWGLSQAEAEVAWQLARGCAPTQIARERGVSAGTVRAQIRTVYDKLEVHSASALMQRLRSLC